MKPSSNRAFTLTELLVVVPVAALLATMLLAVSNDAKQQLQAAACLSNMRQWGLGFMLYANDWKDYFPYDGNPTVSVCDTEAETNPNFKQIIPYVVITDGKRVLHYVRGKKAGEQRLVAKGSIGIDRKSVV